jgi:hypothetical protein
MLWAGSDDGLYRRRSKAVLGGGPDRTADLLLVRHPTVSAMLTRITAGRG